MSKKLKFESIAVHQNYRGDETNSIVRPIHPTSAYFFNDADHGADLFDLKVEGNIYSRLTNPTNDAFANAVNDLEGGVGALAVSSGQAAATLAILTLAKGGDHVVASQSIYGGTNSVLVNTLKPLGIETTFVDQNLSYEELEKAIQPNTKLILAETIGNPLVNVLDFEKFSKLAKNNEIPLVIDNTFATSYLFKPLDHGANIVIYSATKYLGGHGNAIGGVIVDGGNFNWVGNDKFKQFWTPNDAYHGLIYTDVFEKAAFIYTVRTQGLRDIGAASSPFNSYLLATGLQTLPLRLDRSSSNALQLANYLENHSLIEWVSYPLLESHPDYQRATNYFTKGASGIFCFGIKGGLEAGKTFINSLELIIHASNVGDVRTIVTHPASTTHRQMTSEELLSVGIADNLIRVSTGIENIEDLIADIEQALNKTK